MAVGVSLSFKRRYDHKEGSKLKKANKSNNYVIVGVFLITVINVFIATFSIGGYSYEFIEIYIREDSYEDPS